MQKSTKICKNIFFQYFFEKCTHRWVLKHVFVIRRHFESGTLWSLGRLLLLRLYICSMYVIYNIYYLYIYIYVCMFISTTWSKIKHFSKKYFIFTFLRDATCTCQAPYFSWKMRYKYVIALFLALGRQKSRKNFISEKFLLFRTLCGNSRYDAKARYMVLFGAWAKDGSNIERTLRAALLYFSRYFIHSS